VTLQIDWVRSVALTRAINSRNSTRIKVGKQITEYFCLSAAPTDWSASRRCRGDPLILARAKEGGAWHSLVSPCASLRRTLEEFPLCSGNRYVLLNQLRLKNVQPPKGLNQARAHGSNMIGKDWTQKANR
jgi:hypothetical protein